MSPRPLTLVRCWRCGGIEAVPLERSADAGHDSTDLTVVITLGRSGCCSACLEHLVEGAWAP